jgi:twinkle protein
MSQYKATHLSCDDCGSSDARAVYKSGVSICFSCGAIHSPDGVQATGLLPIETRELQTRGITEDTCRRYNYGVSTHQGEPVQVAPYYDAHGRMVAQKIRTRKKDFCILGDAKKMGLFGSQLARRHGKMIVITEGEIDAMAVSQAMGNTWPVLSLPNGASSLKPLKQALEYLETYEKVVLCFDNDEPGAAALEAALPLFSPGKAHVASLGAYKDAGEMLVEAGPKALRDAVWSAKEYRPDGVVSMAELYDEATKPLVRGTEYPWERLNKMTYGFRPGELITWTAGTGVGKTQVVTELEYDVLVRQGLKVGIIHLEEGPVRTARRLVGIDLNKPLHLPDEEVDDDDFNAAWRRTAGSGRAFSYVHFGSVDSEILLNRIRYMRSAFGVDVVFLDHVSIVVSGAELDKDERRMLDRVVTQLKSLCEETGLVIHLVSHLRRPDGKGSHEEGRQVSLSHLRGTQAIGQLSDFVIALERNQQAEDETARNTTLLRVLKNRYAGITGEADSLYFNRDTGRMTANHRQIFGTEEDF